MPRGVYISWHFLHTWEHLFAYELVVINVMPMKLLYNNIKLKHSKKAMITLNNSSKVICLTSTNIALLNLQFEIYLNERVVVLVLDCAQHWKCPEFSVMCTLFAAPHWEMRMWRPAAESSRPLVRSARVWLPVFRYRDFHAFCFTSRNVMICFSPCLESQTRQNG